MTSLPYISLFSCTLFLGSFLALSGNHWIFIWMGLELNLMSFIPLLTSSQQNQEAEAAMKYFLAQSLGSGLLLMSSLSFLASSSSFLSSNSLYLLLLTSLLIKLGLPPCHFWFPSVMSLISWPMCMILASWQKIVPILIMFYTLSSNLLLISFSIIFMSSLIGGIGGLGQTQLRPLFAYSSIGHMSWMLGASLVSYSASMVYFIFYVIISIPIMFILWLNTNSMGPSLNSFNLKTGMGVLLLTPLILSLGGIPPFTGFFPKWMVLEVLSPLSPFLVLILLMGSMINLYYYLNLLFLSLLKSSSPAPYKTSKGGSPVFLLILSSLSLGLTPLFLFLI
uniref:NADH-ubiquinone oxidoreductase chain 2 n=1 Tax=Arctonoe vittata TaxID=862921 RepID=A0A8F2F6Z7_9ANNE|nr:NADH dehydrogenase subunit 2 [Arctonoe vittata]